MKQIVLIASLIFMVSVYAQNRTDTAKLEKEVLEVDTQRADAYVNGDVATLERILADDVTYVHPTGKVETKAEVIAGFKNQDRKYKSIKRDDVVVRIYGNTAVVTGRNTISAEYQGKNYDVQNRFTRVYVKQAGGWRLVAHHGSNIPQQ
jgi:ketosteroid isomerase-like protein